VLLALVAAFPGGVAPGEGAWVFGGSLVLGGEGPGDGSDCTPYEALVTAPDSLAPDPAAALGQPLTIVYTSGTTGRPKGTVLTQEAVFYNAVNAAAIFQMTSRDHILTVLPMFHVGGMNIQTTPAVHTGATVTIQQKFDPGDTLAAIARSRATLLLAVPAVSQAMLAHPDWAKTDVSSLRNVCVGSSAVPEAVIRPWLDRGIPVTQVYGMTESCPVAIALSIEDGPRMVGSTGKPVPHCEARIVDDKGRDAAAGEPGEIILRGPNIMKEYWQNPAATAECFEDGWFHTGDIGHMDEDGFYYIDDRKKDVVISGGENIYPAELENVLADCPDIDEFAVVGRPDKKWGEVPVACIVPKQGSAITEEDVMALFEGRLAGYKHPRGVVFMDGPLPRTSLGKVQKFELRERLRKP
ncbi:MAG: AMP-binding protein, partial [Pseudomonadota bacterium]